MATTWNRDLSRRERQIMDVLFRDGESSVRDVASGIPDAPSHTAIRTLLRILERKGHVRHRPDGRRQLYCATVPRSSAALAALEHVLQTFFGGSLGDAVAAHLAHPSTRLGRDELTRVLRPLIKHARQVRSGLGNTSS
jgi:predicted transcriptional regulator